MAKVIGKNSMADAIRHAESRKDWMDQTPEVLLALKAAVNPAPSRSRHGRRRWPCSADAGRVPRAAAAGDAHRQGPGFKRVPFNISMPVQTGGGTYAWVGEGAPKPVGNLQFSSATLGIAKAAGIIVISEELAKISNAVGRGVVRNDMIKGMAQYLDSSSSIRPWRR
jgi:hypothetical protein